MMLKCKTILSLIMVFAMLSAVIALSAVAVHAEDKNPNTDPTVSVQQGQDPSEDEDIDDSDYDDEYIDDEDFYDQLDRSEGLLPYEYYRFSVAANGAGTATATVDGETFTGSRKVGKRQDQIDDLIVTLTASSDSGTFTDWTIIGRFDIVSGGMDEKVITIHPYFDIEAVANFSDKGKGEVSESEKGTAGTATPDESKTNNGKTSPKTADPAPMVVLMLGLAAATGVLAVKKLKES